MFQSSPELIQAFKLPLERPEKLVLATGETFPTSRLSTEEVEGTEMDGVEHLGQYVFEMTQAKVEMLKEGRNVLPPPEAVSPHDEDKEMDEDDGSMDKVKHEANKSDLDDIT